MKKHPTARQAARKQTPAEYKRLNRELKEATRRRRAEKFLAMIDRVDPDPKP